MRRSSPPPPMKIPLPLVYLALYLFVLSPLVRACGGGSRIPDFEAAKLSHQKK